MPVFKSVVIGAAAGAAGTLGMDLLWYGRFKRGGGSEPFIDWETSKDLEGYENAPAPARTAKAVADLAGLDLPESSARTTNNVVHWITGIGWGKAHGVAAGVLGTTNPLLGLGTAVVAWATSYVVLPRLGVYKPITEYDREVLWQDLSAHLVFGLTLGVFYRMFAKR
ncbi:MAG: hypothetical protein WBZ40_04865 [Acidimicrobiia bacterium]